MNTLFDDAEKSTKMLIGKGLHIVIKDNFVDVYRNYNHVETKSIKKDFEKRLAVVQLVNNYFAKKNKLALAFSISRQTINNWLDSYAKHELLGLINNSKDSWKKNPHRFKGNKARDLEQERLINKDLSKKKKIQEENEQELSLDFETPAIVPLSTDLYKEDYNFENNRYAGNFLIMAMLEHLYQFHDLSGGIYDGKVSFLYLFITMHTQNVSSIEQLKVMNKHELGRILGMSKLPSLPTVWTDIHTGVNKKKSKEFSKNIFDYQALNGLVGLGELSLDGHLFPYYGKETIHKAHFTQRNMMIKGQTMMALHDTSGRVVYFDIQEGQGDIVTTLKTCSEYIGKINCGKKPLIAVDREVWGVKNFIYLKDERIVSWEKNRKAGELEKYDLNEFDGSLELHGRSWKLYEEYKEYSDAEKNTIKLRRVILHNTQTAKRLAIVTTDKLADKSEISRSMLNRWGSNENTFKHMGERTKMHYNPVIDISKESANQNVSNLEYIKLHKELSREKQNLKKTEQKLGQIPSTTNNDNTLRKNEHREFLQEQSKKTKQGIIDINSRLKDIPKRVELDITDEKRFKEFDNEGMNIWGICETAFWNTRKELINQFSKFLPDPRDTIPVLEALIKAPGRIRSTPNTLYIKLETLEVPRYKSSQIQLMRMINKAKIQINGKRIVFDSMVI